MSYSRQKKEGAIPCRSSGEALECHARNHERRCAHRGAFSTSPALAVKFSRFHLSQTMGRTQSLELSDAYYSIISAVCGRQFAKICGRRNATLRLLPWQGQTLPLFHTARCVLKSYAEINKFVYENRCTALRLPRPTPSAIRVFACLFGLFSVPRVSAARETQHPRHRHWQVRQSAV